MTAHTIREQMAHLEALLKARRQEQLAQDQSDIDLALSETYLSVSITLGRAIMRG